ncbi:hypothetical protein [Methanobrevibacter ruminantium]|uniref:hypothetical protein n=1 Tax=Methanobrevibacter ruminantium TaxID=83816 RepID=UPI0026F12F9A|nr:hypothetical protein [Methanobrevibacter ruminantium]
MGFLENHQQNSILYRRPVEIDGKGEARKALAKVHGKTKKHETTKHYLTIQLEEGIVIEWVGDSFLIKGPFTCKIIDKDVIRIKNKKGIE